MRLTEQEFYEAMGRLSKFATTYAARLVLVDGMGINEAARQMSVDKTSVSRLVHKIRENIK